jgi:hypothetical protein
MSASVESALKPINSAQAIILGLIITLLLSSSPLAQSEARETQLEKRHKVELKMKSVFFFF